MFHNEWSAKVAKPLQHTTGTETKTAIRDGVWGTARSDVVTADSESGSANTDRRSFGNSKVPGSFWCNLPANDDKLHSWQPS